MTDRERLAYLLGVDSKGRSMADLIDLVAREHDALREAQDAYEDIRRMCRPVFRDGSVGKERLDAFAQRLAALVAKEGT